MNLQPIPDYGFVVYDKDGKPVKAFGPATPTDVKDGSIQIIGNQFPQGWYVKTEDSPSYLKALFQISEDKKSADSSYVNNIREMVQSIDEGASIVKSTLCNNPARPSSIQVEVIGGFSLGIYGSLKSTVDWDLEKMCPTAASSADQ
jgi:hypothetical protein